MLGSKNIRVTTFFKWRAHQGGTAECKKLNDRTHALAVTWQSEMLSSSRSMAQYGRPATADSDLAPMRRIDELHLNHPFAGSRMMRALLNGKYIGLAAFTWRD